MRAIITVIGKDRIGIIARVCTFLAGRGINISDISQNIVGGYFHMMMIVELPEGEPPFEQVGAELEALGSELGLVIKLQREDIFISMHRV